MLNIIGHQGYANKNHEVLLYIHEDNYNLKRQIIPSVSTNVEKLEPLYLAGGNVR